MDRDGGRARGPDAIGLLSTYGVHGDLDVLTVRFTTAGLQTMDVSTQLGTARRQSIDEMVRTAFESTPLIDRIGHDAYQRIRQESHEVLHQREIRTGCLVPMAAHLVTGRTID